MIRPAHNPTASRRRSFPKRTKRLSGCVLFRSPHTNDPSGGAQSGNH